MANEPEPMYTLQQIADRCHKSIDCVRKWVGGPAPLLKKTKAGGSVLIRESDFQDFLNRSTNQKAA